MDEKPPVVFIVFGGGGDLTRRKVIPALFNLTSDGCLSDKMIVIIVDRDDFSDAAIKKHFYEGVCAFSRKGKPKKEEWNAFAKKIVYRKGDFLAAKTYTALAKTLDEIDKSWGLLPLESSIWRRLLLCSAKFLGTWQMPGCRKMKKGPAWLWKSLSGMIYLPHKP